MGQEKKADYGSVISTFGMKATCPGQSSNMFVTINKFIGPGKYKPVYKSECKPVIGATYNFNVNTIDTDTLAENRDDQEILF